MKFNEQEKGGEKSKMNKKYNLIEDLKKRNISTKVFRIYEAYRLAKIIKKDWNTRQIMVFLLDSNWNCFHKGDSEFLEEKARRLENVDVDQEFHDNFLKDLRKIANHDKLDGETITRLKDIEGMLIHLSGELMKLRIGFIKANMIRDITQEEIDEYLKPN